MPFQVSPGVNVSEIDLTTVVPAVSTTEGALAGVFRWGPVGERILVDSEANLAARLVNQPTIIQKHSLRVLISCLMVINCIFLVLQIQPPQTQLLLSVMLLQT